MKKSFIIIALLSISISLQAQRFEDYFEDKALRLDYTFAGDDSLQEIYVDELVSLPHWYGRKHRLAQHYRWSAGRCKLSSSAIYFSRNVCR